MVEIAAMTCEQDSSDEQPLPFPHRVGAEVARYNAGTGPPSTPSSDPLYRVLTRNANRSSET
jgi:hypothetical protein